MSAAFDPLAAECALACMGLESVLNGSPSWGPGKSMEARQLPKQINECLTRFVSSGPKESSAPGLPPFKYQATCELLSKGPGQAMVDGLNKKMPDPAAASSVAAVATRIATMLEAMVPRRTRTTALGVVPEESGLIERLDFARKWSVGNEPMVVFRDLEAGSLSPDMIHVFVDFWPNLSKLTQEMIPRVQAAIRVKRNKPDWSPTSAVDRQLSMLMGRVSANDLALGGAFSALGAPQAAPPTPPPGPQDVKSNLSTPGQESQAQR